MVLCLLSGAAEACAFGGDFGGGVENLPGKTLSVTGCLFKAKQAKSGEGPFTSGGAMMIPRRSPTVKNSTFLNT